ncbi:hypothetical protein ACLOJK_007268 [Asimina triloba]
MQSFSLVQQIRAGEHLNPNGTRAGRLPQTAVRLQRYACKTAPLFYLFSPPLAIGVQAGPPRKHATSAKLVKRYTAGGKSQAFFLVLGTASTAPKTQKLRLLLHPPSFLSVAACLAHLSVSLFLSSFSQESPLGSRPECKREGWVECNAQSYVPPDTQTAWMQLCSLPRLISTAPTAPPLPSPTSNTSAAAAELPKLAFGEDFDVGGAEPSRTLELFPLHSDGITAAAADKASNASNYQFIQFLPLKN